MKRCLVVTLYLIICLLEFHSTALQLNLHQWKSVNKNGYIITAFLSPFHRDLVGHLKLILTPLLAVEKFYPNTFAVCRVKRIEIPEFFRFFKACSSFKIDKYLFKFLVGKLSTAMLLQPLTIMYLQLPFEIGLKIILLCNLDILIIHLLKCGDKSSF